MKVVIGKDTGCFVPMSAVDTLNIAYSKLDECRELRDSLKSEIRTHETKEKQQTELLESKKRELALEETVAKERGIQLEVKDKEIKRKDRQILWMKIQRGILAGATAILVVMTIVHK